MLLTTCPVPLVSGLADHGERAALVTADGVVTYAALAARVADVAARLGSERRLVLVTGGNDVDALVAHLAAQAAGCPALLVPPGERAAAWVEAYDPDVVLDGATLLERRAVTAHDLHPDLALLLTTSGSTGSPKLVRLSGASLQANAEAVAQALGVRPDDRAVTTLPLHYSYGLSVVHSHLLRGAALVPTGLSVSDPCFWELAERTAATTFAGVPYTFDLLDRVGFAERDLPALRYLTCAGGRLAPDRVRHWAEVGRRRGWDLVVMYGQTEATARMAVLPAALTLEHPDCAGRAVPGGSLRVVDPDEHGVGEVVFSGPNVMLGYAEGPADLALGRVVDELRTGDLGTIGADGLLRLHGRRGRTAKVLGLRLDLGHLEARLAAEGVTACCGEGDGGLVAAAAGQGDDVRLRARVAAAAGLPLTAVRAAHVGPLPRLDTGKPDAQAALAAVPLPARSGLSGDLRALYADVLGREVTDDDSFVSAGGDSLSYVELSLRLEDELGHLPAGWHLTPLRDLRRARTPARGRTLETSVALRALAIVLVVAGHSNALAVSGGAHVLVGVAGYNLARFALGPAPRLARLRHLASSAARIAVPTAVWAAGVALVTGDYGLPTVLQLNVLLGPDAFGPAWQLWFVEALLQLIALVGVLVAVPALDRLERRRPLALPLGLVAGGLLVRYGVLPLPGGPDGIHTAPAVLWLFAVGWAAARARTAVHRAVLSAVLLLGLPGFFTSDQRAVVVAVGLLALVWLPGLPCPRSLRRVAGVLASSSLYVYLTHWQVYPHLERDHPWLGLLASLAVGVATWRAVEAVTGRVRAYCRPRTEAASTQRR